MAVVQSTYTENTRQGLEGMAATTTPCVRDTYTVDESSGIPFGRACSLAGYDSESTTAAGRRRAKLGVAGATSGDDDAATNYIGVSFRDLANEGTSVDSAIDTYSDNDLMVVATQGDIFVKVVAAVTAGDQAAANGDDGQFQPSSASTTDTDTDDGVYLIPRSVYMTSAAANGIAVLRIGTDIV